MSQSVSLETFLNEFLASPQKGRNGDEDQNLKNLFLEFSSLLFSEGEEDPNEAVSIKDIGSFELDEFVNFYLSDMFPEDAGIVSKGTDFVKRMYKFLKKSQHSNKEQLADWEEFIQEL
ncbi:hypothetical protein EHQ12_06995 [Leptospira gomenensis]|uniref:Uncharacterized protein n=1 Tax=Leptospira gomenensis TaxID=2484974 RepID=A0A5F1YG26_9LEPT|nr:hypothetical protein [Leptospira gomenensis]TGK37463.1 hypothetical protein EHQ17_02620 [Leptospira gomenensis]TGK40821.1 hypothetical protein EHQ12_06995 [Leptospira gomenensis]TGK43048.1 hypothetical protein EHQ07_12915 [Leptospira gomenensis]TGK54312.1 hypothetical protein EHQ13_19405 [Leptospira gomenensis]